MKNYDFLKEMLIHNKGLGYTSKIKQVPDVMYIIPNQLIGQRIFRNLPYLTPDSIHAIRDYKQVMIPDNSFLESVVIEVEKELRIDKYKDQKENNQIQELKQHVEILRTKLDMTKHAFDCEKRERQKAEGYILWSIFTGRYNKIRSR